MNEDNLRIFVDIARYGSIAEAARHRGVDASVLSRALSALETELQTVLIAGSTRRRSLTDAGLVFLEKSQRILDAMDDARAAAQRRDTSIKGLVRITASTAFGDRIIMPLLPQLLEVHPHLRLDARFTDSLLDLQDDRIDLAVRLGPRMKGSGVGRRLMTTRYRVCASPALVQNFRHFANPKAIQECPVITYSLAEFQRRWRFRTVGGQVTEVPVTPTHIISSAASVLSACRSGIGLALLADWLCEESLQDKTLIDLFPDHEVTATEFDTAAWLMFAQKEKPPRVKAVADFMIRALAAQARG